MKSDESIIYQHNLSKRADETRINVLIRLLQDLEKRKMAVPKDLAPHEKGNLQLSQNYRTIRLINHLKDVIMKVVLNRLKAKPEEIIADE